MNLVIAIILSVLLNAAPLLAANVLIDMDPSVTGIQPELRVVPGSTFSVDVVVTGVDGTVPLDVYQFKLQFDPNVLRRLNVTSGSFLTDGTNIPSEGTQSEINWNEGVTARPGASGDGILTTITFEAIGSGTSHLRLSDVITAGLGQDITGAFADGIVTVEALPTVTIVATDGTATEAGPTTGFFTVSRTGSTTSALTVNYAVSGTATTGSDYQMLSGNVLIAAGQSTAVITVSSFDDAVVGEPDETVVVQLQGNAAYIEGTPNNATVIIVDNDAAPAGSLQFSSSTYSVNESGGGTVAITVTRTGGSNGAVGVTFTTSNGTAQSGSDYTAVVNQMVSFANGETTSKTVNIPILNDTTFEVNETVILALSNATGGATLGSPSTAVLTIVDDDPDPNVGRAPFVYVAHMSSNGITGAVSVIDTARNVVVDTIPVGVTPVGVVVNPSGTKVYVANFADGTVSVIDTATKKVVPISLGLCPNPPLGPRPCPPSSVAVSPDGAWVYVTHLIESADPETVIAGAVSVINTDTDRVAVTLRIELFFPVLANGIAVSPQGDRIYVANNPVNEVLVLDAIELKVIDRITVPSNPAALAVSPDGTKIYVTNQDLGSGPTDPTPGTLSVINSTTKEVKQIQVGKGPQGVAVSPDGNQVYVANSKQHLISSTGTVSVISGSTDSPPTTIPVGKQPFGVAVHPDGSLLYVTNVLDGTVSVIDTDLKTAGEPVRVGFNNFAIAIGPGPVAPPTDTTPPNLIISSHSNNQTVNSNLITVSGTASDSGLGNSGISSVTVNGAVAINGTASGSGTTNWSQSIALARGANVITVVARDNSANKNATTVQITINYQPLSITGLTADKNSPQPGGGTINFTATTTGGIGPIQFKWWLLSNGVWSIVKDWSASNTFSWTPTQGGSYRIGVWAKSFGNPNNVSEAFAGIDFSINPPPVLMVTNLTVDEAAPQLAGSTINFTATTSNGLAPIQFKWWLFNGVFWTVLKDWSTSNVLSWTPMAGGSYRVGVWTRSNGNAADAAESNAFASIGYSISPPPVLMVTSLAADRTSPQAAGTTINFTATTSNGLAPIQFKWWLFNGVSWTMVKDWSTSDTFSWTPMAGGSYRIGVWARSNGNMVDAPENNAFASIGYSVNPPPVLMVTNLAADRVSPQVAGTTINFTATTSNGLAPIQFKWWLFNGVFWTVVKDWSPSSVLSWTPTVKGNYRIGVWAKSSGNNIDAPEGSAFRSVDFSVAGLMITSLSADKVSPQPGGSAINFTSTSAGGSGPIQFKWWLFNGLVWTVVKDWSTSNTFSWTPTIKGNYRIGVWARSSGMSVDAPEGDAFRGIDFTVSVTSTILFVEPAGMCNGNTPCLSSIQQAIISVTENSVIRVAQGTYHVKLLVDSSKIVSLEGGWNSTFSIRAVNPALTIIDGDIDGDGIGDSSVIRIEASGAETVTLNVNGFTIQNGNSTDGGGIFASAVQSGTVNLNVVGSIIRNNESTNSAGGVGVYAENPGSHAQATLTNNMIFNNQTAGNGGGVYGFSSLSANTTLVLINNTISGNTADLSGGGLRAYAANAATTSATVKNTIIWGNSAANGLDIALRNSLQGFAQVTAFFSDIGDVLPDADAPGTYNDLGNNIDADPMFVNSAGGDFRLGPGSLAIDAGTSDGAPMLDFEGHARPQGTGYDIGADERL